MPICRGIRQNHYRLRCLNLTGRSGGVLFEGNSRFKGQLKSKPLYSVFNDGILPAAPVTGRSG